MKQSHKIRYPLLLIGFALLSTLHCAGMKPSPRFTGSPPSREERPPGREPATEGPGRDRGTKPTYNDRYGGNGRQARLTQEIESYLGVPYRWGGASRYGMDCSGFVSTVYRSALGVELPRKARAMFDEGRYVAKRDLQFGELVFFEKIENSGVSHVGIYIGGNRFAHASTTRGVVISDLDEKYYRRRFVGARKILTIKGNAN